MIHRIKYLIILIITFLTCCTNNKDEKMVTSSNKVDSLDLSLDSEVLSIKYNNSVYSLPSPHHASLLVKKNDINFNPDYTNDIEKANNYVTNMKKALNLGVYGTDLGYINIYGQTQEAYRYFEIIQKLSTELKVINALEYDIMEKIDKNVGNSDSLILYLSTAYAEINRYLKNNDREEIGALIVAGGWIESLYIVAQYYLQEDNPVLFSYLGEQKYPLDNLIRTLEPFYGKNEDFSRLFDDFVNLAYIFDNIEFKNEVVNKQIIENKHLTIITNESEMECYKDILDSIAEEITKIRNRIVE